MFHRHNTPVKSVTYPWELVAHPHFSWAAIWMMYSCFGFLKLVYGQHSVGICSISHARLDGVHYIAAFLWICTMVTLVLSSFQDVMECAERSRVYKALSFLYIMYAIDSGIIISNFGKKIGFASKFEMKKVVLLGNYLHCLPCRFKLLTQAKKPLCFTLIWCQDLCHQQVLQLGWRQGL